jgi:type I restriction enzyme, S subunit
MARADTGDPRSVDARFLGYLFLAEFLIAEVISRSVGVSHPAINSSELMRIFVAIPNEKEQAAIAAFLDRETEIDALVDEQKLLSNCTCGVGCGQRERFGLDEI